jgi:hypothetical protein
MFASRFGWECIEKGVVKCAFCDECCAVELTFTALEFELKHKGNCCWKFVHCPEEFLFVPRDDLVLIEMVKENLKSFDAVSFRFTCSSDFVDGAIVCRLKLWFSGFSLIFLFVF